MKHILLIIFLFTSLLFASQIDDVFHNGVDAYKNKDYEKALDLFLSIDREDIDNADLFYNIGNCYFRNGDIGRSVLYMKKAIKVDPKHKAAKRELEFLLTQTKDKQEIEEKNFIMKMFINLDHFFTLNYIAIIMLISFILAVIFLSYAMIIMMNDRTIPNFFSGLFFAIFIMFGIYAVVKNNNVNSKIEGVITSKSVAGFSGPSQEYQRVFTIHDGMQLLILKSESGWAQVQLPNGIGGWIPEQSFSIVD